MAKKIQLQDANGNVLHPLTLGECVTMDNGENLDTLMSKSQMFTPTITQDKSMFKVGTGVDVDYSANVKDGAYESLVFKGKSLVNLGREIDSQYHNIGGEGTQITSDGYFKIPYAGSENSHSVRLKFGLLEPLIKPDTVYSLIVEIVENTTQNARIGFTGHNNLSCVEPVDKNTNIASAVGTHVKLIKRRSEVTARQSDLYFCIWDKTNVDATKHIKFRYMILEGDWTNKELPPFFTGIGYAKMPILHTTGKNLLYYGEILGTPSITSYSLSNNKLTIANDGAKNYQQINFVYKDLLNYKGKTLTLSGYATPNKADLKPCFQVVFQDSSGKTYYFGSTNSANTTKRMSRTFTIPYDISSDYTPRISFIVHNANESGYSGTAVFSEIMLEESPSPTTYEDHKTNILRTSEEIVLREVGGVCDTYNPLTGEYTKRIGEIILDGSDNETWGSHEVKGDNVKFAYYPTLVAQGSYQFVECLCDKWKADSQANETIQEQISLYNHMSNNTPQTEVRITVSPTRLQSVDTTGFRAWLSQNPLTVQYILAEPVTTIVKPSTMTPFAYQNGHVILESGFEGQSLLPEIEYGVVTGRTGQVTQNTKVLRKQEQQIIGLEELLLTQVVQMEYERTLLQFDYELQMMMLG